MKILEGLLEDGSATLVTEAEITLAEHDMLRIQLSMAISLKRIADALERKLWSEVGLIR